MKNDPERGLNCFDWDDDDDLKGQYVNDDYLNIEFQLHPCNYHHTIHDY